MSDQGELSQDEQYRLWINNLAGSTRYAPIFLQRKVNNTLPSALTSPEQVMCLMGFRNVAEWHFQVLARTISPGKFLFYLGKLIELFEWLNSKPAWKQVAAEHERDIFGNPYDFWGEIRRDMLIALSYFVRLGMYSRSMLGAQYKEILTTIGERSLMSLVEYQMALLNFEMRRVKFSEVAQACTEVYEANVGIKRYDRAVSVIVDFLVRARKSGTKEQRTVARNQYAECLRLDPGTKHFLFKREMKERIQPIQIWILGKLIDRQQMRVQMSRLLALLK